MAENEYDSVVSEIASETSGKLKQNNFANQDSNPDEEAKALSYANKFGTSREIVKSDIKSFETKDIDNEYSEIVKTLPKTTEYLADIDNHAISKDDTDSLGFFEKTGTSFLERASVNLTDTVLEAGEAVLDRFAYGSLEAAQGISKFIRMRQDKSRFDLENDLKKDPTNQYAKQMLDYMNMPGSIGGEALKGFESKLEKEKEQFRSEQAEKSIFDEFKKGNVGSASRTMLLQGLQSTPQLVALMLNPALGTTSLFASSSGSKYDENIKAGLPVDQATSNALVTGSIETGAELVFGLGKANPFKQTIKNAEKMLGKQSALALVKGVASDLLKNSGEEGVEEVLSNTTSSLYDWATDANPQALDGMLGKNIDAFFGGFGGGFVAGGGGAIYSYKAATKRVSDKLRASAVVETMDQFGKAALESKTLKRSPEKFQQFVDGQAAGTSMEKVYISPESANEYFQSKNIDPAKGFQDLGMLPEYEKAMETGADITLPLGKYITNSINTEHYDGLKNDVKFNPNDFTEKQIKQQEKALRDEVNQVKAKFETFEKEGSAIVSDIYDQVKASGESHDTAKAHAILWEAIGTMAIRENRSPKELYRQFGFKIIGPKTQVDPFALPDEEIDPVGGGELFQAKAQAQQNELGFYSKLEQTVMDKAPNSSSPEQLKAILKEVKAEELKYSGLDEFLAGKEKVSKADVLEFIRGNQIQIREVKLSDTAGYMEGDGRGKVHRLFVNDDYIGAYNNVREAEAEAEKYTSEDPEALVNIDEVDVDGFNEAESPESSLPTKFSQYTLPGGENYREVLFTLPEAPASETVESVGIKQNEDGEWDVVTENGRVVFTGTDRTDAVAYRNELGIERARSGKSNDYKSSHFDQKNILAHTRLTDRTDADGKKVLFIEEIQSDWHQDGRKKGYKFDEKKLLSEAKDLREEREQIFKDDPKLIASESDFFDDLFNKTDEELAAKYNPNAARIQQIDVRVGEIEKELRANNGTVPDAPFKKNWQELAFKRILKMAADQGYDRVSWTTGEQQAERFDLSKQVDYVTAVKNADGTFDADAYKNGDVLSGKANIPASELDSLFGKDLAEKIRNESGKEDKQGVRKYEGVDLKVGGEGMKGFYDKILVDYANKIAKKYDVKVKDTEINTVSKENNSDLELLNDLGVEASGSSKTSVHTLEITPQMKADISDKGFELFQENRGSYNPRTKVIKALESKNETTLLHEYGHAFLDVFQYLATSPTASEAIKKDFDGLLKFLEVESASDIKTPQHEKFARYFEGYLMEGKSPSNSKAMVKAFNSFKMWMIKNYQSVEGLSDAAFEQQKEYLKSQGKDVSNLKREDFAIKMNDDIRGFMNRMIVAEEQIQEATENLGINHLFKDPIGMGMNEEQALKYKEAIEEANIYAEAELTKRLMTDLHKKQKQEYKEKFQDKFNEIKALLLEDPVYEALEVLKTGKDTKGQVIEDPIKLNRESLVRNFGKEVANLLPRSVFSENGLHYQEAAEAFGFDNAVDFITDMTQAEDINTVAKREAEAVLQKQYPDLLNDPKITDEANMAVHNEKRSKVLQLELQFLEENYKPLLKDAIRRITGRSSLNQQIREAARQNLEKQSVGSIKPHEYAAAERKTSREAAKALAAGDIKKAYEYKRMEYLNHEYYRQAVEAVAFVEKSVSKYSKVFKGNADVAKTRDLDYVNTARAVLGLYGIVSTKNESPLKYLQKTALYDKEKFGSIQSLLQDAIEGAGNYNQVSYNQFQDMINTVDALWDMSREMKTIEVEGKKVELSDALGDLSKLFDSWNENKKDVTITGSVSDKEKSSVNYLGFGASLKVVGTYIDYIDNNIPDGPFKKYVWYPVVKAGAKYRVEASKINKQLNDIVVKYDKIFKDDKIYTADELTMTDENGRNVNFSFKKSDLIMMILHSGNKSNKSKLVRGGRIYEGKQYAWGHLNDDGSLNSANFDRQFAKWRADGTLTKADYDFAQEIWNMLESMKPDLQKAHKKTEGFYFNEVTADEFTNEFGTYTGGYIPAKVDVYTDEKAALRQEKDRAENLNNSYAFPTVSKGSTMSRVEAFAAPLSLEFNLLAGHVDWAVKYTYLNPAIKNVNKIVLNDGFRESLKQVDPVAGSEMLVPWLTRAAEQRSIVPSQGDMKTLDAGFKLLRQRFSLQVLAGSVANMLQNFGSTIIANSKTPAKHIMAASVELLKNRTKTLEFIQDSSDFMKSEMNESAQRALQQGVDIITQTGKYAKLQDLGQQAAGFLDNTTTVFVKQQVWLAEYNNLVEGGMRHEQAVNGADDLTRKITSVINPEDVSRIMTGSQTKAFFTQFAGYFNRILNYRYYGVRSIQKELGLGTREGMTRLVPFVLASAVLPAMYAALVSKALAGKLTEDEDKDGKYWDDLMKSLFGVALFKETVAGIPYVGQAANYTMNRYNNNPVDDKLSLAPSAALFELGVSLPAKIIRDASKDELRKQTVKDSLTIAGAISGLPVGWFGKPIGYVMDVKDRKAKPTGPIDYTRGLVTGQPGKK